MQRDHICLNPIFEGIEIKPFFLGGGAGVPSGTPNFERLLLPYYVLVLNDFFSKYL